MLCGLWVYDDGRVHTSVATAAGGREERSEQLRPFAWLSDVPVVDQLAGLIIEPLKGEGTFKRLAHAENFEAYDSLIKLGRDGGGLDAIRPLESQYLLQQRQR